MANRKYSARVIVTGTPAWKLKLKKFCKDNDLDMTKFCRKVLSDSMLQREAKARGKAITDQLYEDAVKVVTKGARLRDPRGRVTQPAL